MANARTDDDTTVYLVANIDSKKVAELTREPRVALSIQDREGIAMIDAEARVSQDRALIDELWQDSWSVWFERGKDDPNVAILVIQPLEGTYWDQDLGHGLSYLWRMIKARVGDHTMEVEPGDQSTVEYRGVRRP